MGSFSRTAAGNRAQQFERMVGIVKGSLYKTIGNGFLTCWTELEEVVLDVEVAVNNRPLGYTQDDV